MTERPLVSIITPTFNRFAYLRRAMASVQAQSYRNIQHIVIDGGSSDGTTEFLSKVADSWNVTWVSEPDGGMYDAIDKGISRAQGDIVGWLNSDDLLTSRAIEQIVDQFGRYDKKWRNHAVYADCLSVEVATMSARLDIFGQMSMRDLATFGHYAQPTVYWPRCHSEAAGTLGDSRYTEVADCEYWLRLGEHVEFVKLREVIAVVCNHPGTKRNTLQARIREELDDIRQRYGAHGPKRMITYLHYRAVNAVERMAYNRGAGWQETPRTGVKIDTATLFDQYTAMIAHLDAVIADALV